MSKFTTEVRRICETYADDPTLSIEETITKAKPYIFSNIWNATSDERKEEIEQKILRHYYTQEIGFETVGLWKLHLNATLAEIMPKYNVLYSNLDDIKDKLFQTVDYEDILTSANAGHTESTSKSSGTGHTTDTNTANSETSTNSTANTETSGDSSSNATAKNKYNDTPQGALDGLETGTYLTNATINESETTSQNTTKSTGTTTNTGNDKTTATSQTDSTTGSTGSNTGDSTSNTNSNRHVFGKNTGGDYLSQWLTLMDSYEDVDRMIIAELQPLFMGLWE